MVVAAPETNTLFIDIEQEYQAVAVPEMAEDVLARRRAERLIGACALEKSGVYIDTAESVRPIESLHDAIQKAAEGDKTAKQLITINARTDVIERTIKSGHVMKVRLDIDQSGKVRQFGQSMETVQANSLRFAANNLQMRNRVEAETTNSYRIEQLYHAGILENHSFVVFSCAPDDMSIDSIKLAGFFTETMSCAIQVTSAKGKVFTTESAFVSGVKNPGAKRHDIDAIVAVAKKLGVDLSGKSVTEILNTPLLIPNSLLQNGAIDIVKMYDEAIDGDTFFGEVRERQDYLQYQKQCEERERTLEPKVDLIAQELINESPFIHDRIHAVKRLHKISSKHMVQQAIFDESIDLRVFGEVSAAQILEARLHFEQGNNEIGLEKMNQAIKYDQSNSCASGAFSESSDTNDNSSTEKDCTFVSKSCPMCGRKNVLTTVTATRITGSCRCSKVKSKSV